MRAWTIVVFILAIHACLAMIGVANITDVGLNITLDTSGHGSIAPSSGNTNLTIPSSTMYNTTDPENFTYSKSTMNLNQTGFVGMMLQQVTQFASLLSELMTTFSRIVFSIYYLTAPYFGHFNAVMLEGLVDFIFSIALFQMVTGRSFKTME